MEIAMNIKRYEDYLKNEEKADSTISKFTRGGTAVCLYG